ncbi:hypothetical protein Q7P37_003928 [Cladosporium fusiforme]
MEAPRRAANRQKQRSRRFWIILSVVVLVVLIVVIVPTAVILSGRQRSKGLASSVILPLYIYPLDDAWQPLYNALNATSDLNYTIVVNPDSGPGDSSLPNDDYFPAIQKLNTFPNVRTVGYVRTGYGNRTLSDVLQDISTYSGWSNSSQGIEMHGIFFDEAPHEYSADHAQYMKEANDAVRDAVGIRGNKTIIHNPGVVPDTGLELDTTDITVVFEQSFEEYRSLEDSLTSLSGDRSEYSFMVHSVPSKTNLQKFVDSLSHHAEYLFVTTADANYYNNFSASWEDFTKAMPS